MVTPATTINIINEERDPRDLMDTSMAIKVVKFGGSSLADAKQIQKAAAIIQADPQRRYVVPSAPGKRFSGDTKVTDMLYACYALAEAGVEFQRRQFRHGMTTLSPAWASSCRWQTNLQSSQRTSASVPARTTLQAVANTSTARSSPLIWAFRSWMLRMSSSSSPTAA